jgi:hypothetical protein
MRQDSFSLTDFFNFVLSYYCCTRGSTLRHLQKFFQCILVKFTSPSFSFIPPHPLLRTVSAGLIFPFSYVSTKHFHHFTLLHSFPISSPLLLVPNPRQDLFYLPSFLKKHISVCFRQLHREFHYDISMYTYISNWFIPSIFLLSTLVHL